jgi:crossover junction endodeoxyribonuclease RuvC
VFQKKGRSSVFQKKGFSLMNDKEKIILGVDPGTLVTGFGVILVSGQKYKALDFGCIRPPPSLKLSERYHIIATALGEIVEKHTPSAIAVETQYVAKNVQSALKLGMARGVVMVTARQKGVSIFQYSPSHAKKAVVGRGSASKSQVQEMVKLLLGLSRIPEPADAADALALAICHAHTLCYHDPSEMEI